MGEHPVGSAYGLYHFPQRHPGPVDVNAIVVIDARGILRAVEVRPDTLISATDVLALVATGLALNGESG